MSSFTYYSLPSFGEQCRQLYGFSDACIIGDHLIVTGQTGMNPYTSQTSPDLEDQVAQAFENIKSLIERTLQQAGYVVKLHAYVVGLSAVRDEARAIMVRHIKKACPNHQALFTTVGIESLPFAEHRVELEVDVWLP
ncbi:hypothetical protein ABZX51_011313 [Aspergillus tubingensis]|uniref:Uncharacterized protein n=1 Tax=Aspergillus niger TaxID=5061 RepID=A0A100IKX9_ASPNG|nr:hypothetical protein ANI_1_1650104 [Aspergillus niger]GLA61072.1 hypothetical protein AtubIFM54640_001580 [Aspergillus tubingensis]GLA98263.1 hypothetical protein AtubIFM57143_006202 [Aspergillus tubingensis]